MPGERYKTRISIGCESDSVMKALSAALTICMVLLATDRVSARHWPDPAGGTVEGDLVLIRQNTIVIRTEDPGVVLVEIPYEKLRDLDRRFLLRKHRYHGPRAIVPESRLDFRIIDASPRWYWSGGRTDSGSTPATLVAAVNHLRNLGKENAIKTLNEYMASGKRDVFYRVFVIVPLVFAPQNVGDGLPSPTGDDEYELRPDGWHPYFISSANEVPFNSLHEMSSFPVPPSARYLTRWAAEHGIIQQGVLRPGDPLAAAETVIERLQRNDDDPAVVAHIRRQAWECVAHLFPLEWNCTFALEPNDERWAMLKTLSATLDIRWSDEKQQYVNSNQGVKLPQPSESLLSRP